MKIDATMKLTIRLIFLFLPVFASCQINDHTVAPKSSSDSLVAPSLDSAWTVSEFQDVFTRISSQQKDTSAGMIRVDNNRRLFTKLTDTKSYWFLSSKRFTLDHRFTFNLTLQNLIKTVFLQYYQRGEIIEGKLRYEQEVAAFCCLLFYMAQSQLELADEFLIAKPDLTQIQINGFKKMINGLEIMISSALLTFEKEYMFYSEASICKLGNTFKDFYSIVLSKIDENTKNEFDKRITTIIKTHSIVCLRTTLQALPK